MAQPTASVQLIVFGKRILRWTRTGRVRSEIEGRTYSRVQFYERLVSLLEQRGLERDKHLTPLEFANEKKITFVYPIKIAIIQFVFRLLSDQLVVTR